MAVDEPTAHDARPDPAGPGARRRRRRPGGGRAPGDPRNIGWLYVLPGLAVYLLFTLAPLLHTVYYSLFDWDGLTGKTWVGLSNYGEALRDEVLRDSFVHSAILIVYYAVFPVIIGLLLTAALTRTVIRGFRFFRTALFLPQLIAGVVIAQAWTWIYAADGPLNRALELVGPRIARAAVARRLHVGAAVDRCDRQLGHLRAVHGALHRGGAEDPHVALRRGPRRRRRACPRVLRGDAAGAPGRDPRRVRADDDQRAPELRHRVQHDGRRPGGETLVPSMYMYQNAFLYNRVGYAAAIATVLAVTIFLLAAIVLRIGSRGERT